LPTGAIVYRGLEVIVEPDEKEKELVEYAFQVVTASSTNDTHYTPEQDILSLLGDEYNIGIFVILSREV
jgi:hypothetical protein